MHPPAHLMALHRIAPSQEHFRRSRLVMGCEDSATLTRVDRAGEIVEEEPWPVQILCNGVRIARDGHAGPWMTQVITKLKGCHDPQAEKVFHHLLESLDSAQLMVELGAFPASYSLGFLQRFPNARSVMLEPDPNHLAIAQYNFALNGREGTFLQVAASKEPLPPATFTCKSDGVVRGVRRVSVDSLVEEMALPAIDLLMANIQGAELTMLQGMAHTVAARKLRHLLVFTHDHTVSGDYATHQRCLHWIKNHGGHILVEYGVDESFSGNGLIAASFHETLDLTVAVTRNRGDHSLYGSPRLRLAQMAMRLADAGQENQTLRDLERKRLQVKQCRATLQRQLRLEAAPKPPWWDRLSSVRRLTRLLDSRRKEKQALGRLHDLRTQNKTDLIPGLQGIFEVLREEKVITPAMMRQLHWDYDITKQVVRLVEASTGKSLRGATLLDIGANIGMIGIQALSAGLMRRCLAFEPEPTNFALLWSNVRLNALQDSFDLHAVALGTRTGTCSFEISPTNCGDHRVRTRPPDEKTDRWEENSRATMTVAMQDLDSLLDTCPGDFTRKIGLCWMDVQGFEAEVIRGGQRHFSQHGWPTVIEFWPYGLSRAGVDPHAVQTLLASVWTKFVILKEGCEPALHPIDKIEGLWHHIGLGEAFENLLLLR